MQQEIKREFLQTKKRQQQKTISFYRQKTVNGPKASIEPLYDGYIYNEFAANPEPVVEHQQSVVTLHTICGVISFQVGFVRASCLVESNLKQNCTTNLVKSSNRATL